MEPIGRFDEDILRLYNHIYNQKDQQVVMEIQGMIDKQIKIEKLGRQRSQLQSQSCGPTDQSHPDDYLVNTPQEEVKESE